MTAHQGTNGTEYETDTAQYDAISSRTVVERDTAIDEVLATGGTLSDEQIKHLHLVCGWSPNRIALCGGLRGQKQVRLERIYAVLGLRRAASEVEQPA